MNIQVTKIHFTQDLVKVDYRLNGKPQVASDDAKNELFEDAMNRLVPVCIKLKDLPKSAAKDYVCNAISISNKPTEEGDNMSACISCKKTTTLGKADNISTAHHKFESTKDDDVNIDESDRLAIREVLRQAVLFIKGIRDLKSMYDQVNLIEVEEEKKQKAS